MRIVLYDWIIPALIGVGGFMLGFSKAATLLIFVAASVGWYFAKQFWNKRKRDGGGSSLT